MRALIHVCLALPILLLSGCSDKTDGRFQGYIEGEYVYVASPRAGALDRLLVSRGDEVQTGQLLFALDPEPERSVVVETESRVAQAESRLANLSKGARPSEIAALEARLASAKADAEFAESEVKRFEQLSKERVISPDEMDRSRTRRDSASANVATLEAELETARLGARSDEIKAAAGEVEQAKAALSQARWMLDQKQQVALTNGVIDDTLFRVGEWVGGGKPVVSLLPPTNLKVRFFVPEPQLALVEHGQIVSIEIDGRDPFGATVSYISTQAEFTPPVIYSRENRAKLVYMIEAVFAPDSATSLHPGQPVDVRLQSSAP